MKILNFASHNIDYIYHTSKIVGIDETLITDKPQTSLGGKGFNQSVAMGRSGVKVSNAGLVGKEFDEFSKALTQNNVDVEYLRQGTSNTGYSIVQIDNLGRCGVFVCPMANNDISEKYIDEVLGDFSKGDMLVFQTEIGNTAYLAKTAHKRGMTIVLYIDPVTPSVCSLDFGHISVVIIQQQVLFELTGCSDLPQAFRWMFNKNSELEIVLLADNNGAIWANQTKTVLCSPYEIDVKDSTVAKDAFVGYYVAEMYRQNPVSERLRIALAAQVLTMQLNNGYDSIPYYKEVRVAANSLKSKNSVPIAYVLNCDIILNYVRDNPSTANLEELSKILGYSKYYTSSFIKKNMNITFTELVMKIRCELAESLLLQTDETIESIIEKCGYMNKSFFRRCFKKKTGMTPLEFRNKLGNS